MNLVLFWCFVNLLFGSMMTDNNNRNAGNYNDSQPYVVGILSPSTTLYIDQAPTNNGNLEPPTDLNLARRNTNSFQITSVTVQGSRKNDDQAYDSADDLDESHTDDLSSDFLDSSKADYEGYHSEDNIDELASPCGQQFIFAQLPNMVDRNMNLSIGVTPTFAAISPVAGGVTMMTSKSESPISAQVPIMNPLPNNWQRRFKVVKIVSSEPFKRGRWLCMDFKDPPADGEGRPGTNTPPTIQITNCDPDDRQDGAYLNVENFAQIYEIPINQTFSGNFVMGNQQHMYGIILPQNEFLQPVTLVQDLSLQTTNTDRNFNNLVNHNSLQSDPIVNNQTQPPVSTVVNIQSQQPVVNNNHLPMVNSQPVVGALINNQSPPVGVVVNNQSPPASPKKQNSFSGQSEAVLNHINSAKVNCDSVVPPAVIAVSARSRNNSSSNSIPLSSNHALIGLNRQGSQPEASESFACLNNKLSRTSGLPGNQAADVSNGVRNSPPPPIQAEVQEPPKPMLPTVVANTPPVSVTPPLVAAETNSSQTAPEKLPSEVGPEVDPSTGSAAPTGANTVAIDNKIEQAMDLVKSHLMFAVREEVEVLKEKITELLERISQLEHENDILRANASAETLKQLNNRKKSSAGGTTLSSPPST